MLECNDLSNLEMSMKTKIQVFLLLILFVFVGVFYRIYSSQTFILPWQRNVGESIVPSPLPLESKTDSTAHPTISTLDPTLSGISLPKGFVINYFADNVPGARSMTLGEKGTVFVGTKDKGVVYALPDTNRDMKADRVVIVDKDLDTPNGVAYKEGALYVSLVDRILKYDVIDSTYELSPTPSTLIASYPNDTHHGWKYISFGPDGLLYVPVGAPCNICEKEDPYASITRLDVSDPTKGFDVVIRGIRNTVGFAWDPMTEKLWFTDNGRDLLGDNIPPDELNRVDTIGAHFGYPYCHAGSIIDPQFGKGKNCADYIPPQEKLSPHAAALGMKFYTATMFPEDYQNKVFIAEHGSWNRSEKIGYRVTQVTIDEDGNAKDYGVFADGWLQGEKVTGRPVDVLVYTDGSLLVSDDLAGAIYRISYQE